jgi:hypothetical protein
MSSEAWHINLLGKIETFYSAQDDADYFRISEASTITCSKFKS